MSPSPRKQAEDGVTMLEDATVDLLRSYPSGLTNAEIAILLGIESGASEQNRNYLSWSILGRLVRAEKIEKEKVSHRRVVYRTL